jgi:hypothetical protein
MKLTATPSEKKGLLLGLIVVAIILAFMWFVLRHAPLARLTGD